ncbi:MAG: hypothetical protein HOV94_24015 [Saccharothrix sp.]|nr:hypothetical protein [Saccharothrix sp.]
MKAFLSVPVVAALIVALTAAPAHAAPLRPPTDVVASGVTDTAVTLSWQAAAGASGYEVLRGVRSGGPYTTVGRTSALSYADSGLTASTSYFYVVRGTAGTKSSADSAQLAVTTAASPPTNVRHTAHTDHVELSWDAAPGAQRYHVVRADESGANKAEVGSTSGTSYVDSSVTVATAYTYWVRAEGGADSAPVAVFTGHPTTTEVTVSPGPSEEGQFVLLTATVRPFDGAIVRYQGEVVFLLDGVRFAAATVQDGRGVAERRWLASAGRVTAEYRGDRSTVPLGSSTASTDHTVVPRTSPSVSFSSLGTYGYGLDSSPTSSAVADVTGDGRLDALLTTMDHGTADETDFKLWVFAQQEDGALAPPKVLAGHGAPAATMRIATGDVDADGDTDVAVTARLGVDVFVQGAGGLGEPVLVPVEGAGSSLVQGDARLADLDGDGRADLVVAGVERVVAFHSLAGGGFGPAVPVEQAQRYQVEVADVTGDGRPDIITRDRFQTVVVHAQTADGGFAEWWREVVPTGYFGMINAIAVADVSGDGRADLVATVSGNVPGSRVQVYVQGPSGGFTTPTTYSAYDSPEPVVVTDLDGDGRNDVVIAHGGWRTLSVFPQRPDGRLGAERFFDLPSYATVFDLRGLSTGDVTGDGKPDVVLADYLRGLVVLS